MPNIPRRDRIRAAIQPYALFNPPGYSVEICLSHVQQFVVDVHPAEVAEAFEYWAAEFATQAAELESYIANLEGDGHD